MRTFKRTMSSFLVLLAFLFFASQASAAFLNNWYLDIDGAGPIAPTLVSEYLDIVGPAYIQNTFIDASNFTFTEVAVFRADSHDGGNTFDFIFDDYELTGYFTGGGTGTLGGDINFTYGTLDVYADSTRNYATATSGTTGAVYGANDGINIATFSLISGEGTVDATGIPNGQITVSLESTYMLDGYFFDNSMNDLSLTEPIEWILGFSTTNASWVANPSDIVISEFGVGANNPPFNLVVSSNGQYRLAPIPEPSTFLLLGGGLVGLGFYARRKKK